MTRLLILGPDKCVQSPFSPSLSLFLLLVVRTAVEALPRGLALAGLPGVERSLAVFQSGRCTPCLSYGSCRSTTFCYTVFYM